MAGGPASSRMKCRLAILSGGFSLVCLLAIHFWKPVPAVDSPALPEPETGQALAASGKLRPTTQPFAVIVAPNQDLDETDNDETSEDNGVEVPVAESNWARELREMKELAARQPGAALAQVADLADKDEREIATKEICLVVAQAHPAEAMTAAWDLELGRDGGLSEQAALEKLAEQWAMADLPAAFAWASGKPVDEDGRRDLVLKGIASVWAQTLPREAARLVAEDMSPDHVQFEAAMNVLSQWVARDPEGAAAWVELFPPGPLRDAARAQLAKAASRQNSSVAGAN